MNAGIYQTLASKAKGNMYNVVLCRYVFEWSDSKSVCDINTIQTSKSHRPHHCLQIAIIIHHHPRHHHFDHHHYKHFYLQIYIYIYIYIYIDECSEKIHVFEVNAKCTNADGSHTALHGWIITGISNSLKFKELADHCIRIYFCSSRNCNSKEW